MKVYIYIHIHNNDFVVIICVFVWCVVVHTYFKLHFNGGLLLWPLGKDDTS